MSKKQEPLTKRETEVLCLLIDGYSNNEVTQILGISISTVEGYRARLMVKLDLHDLPALVKYGLKNNLTTLDKHRDHPNLPD